MIGVASGEGTVEPANRSSSGQAAWEVQRRKALKSYTRLHALQASKDFGGCVLRGTLTHTCSSKRFLGKTHRLPQARERTKKRVEVPPILPAGPKSQLPLPYTQPAGSLIAWLLPVSLQPERLATLAALLCTSGPRAIEGRRGTDFGRPGNPTDRHCGSGEPREGPGHR